MRAWIAAACIACASLGGCGLFGGDDSKRAPSALVEFKAAMTPRVLWSTSIGSSGPFSLVPAEILRSTSMRQRLAPAVSKRATTPSADAA